MTTITQLDYNGLDQKAIAAIVKAAQGGIRIKFNDENQMKEFENTIATFEKSGYPSWAKAVPYSELLLKFDELERKTIMELGKTMNLINEINKVLVANDIEPIKPLNAKVHADVKKAPVQTLVLVDNGLQIVDGAVKVKVDVVKFDDQMKVMLGKLKKDDIVSKVLRQSAENDFWLIVEELLNVETSYDLIGILSARLLMAPTDRDGLDRELIMIDVLRNKVGRLMQTTIRLIGYVGLASIKNDETIKHAMSLIANPILGQIPVYREGRKSPTDTEEVRNAKAAKQRKDFDAYVKISGEMQAKYKPKYDNLSEDTKAKIRVKVQNWCVGT